MARDVILEVPGDALEPRGDEVDDRLLREGGSSQVISPTAETVHPPLKELVDGAIAAIHRRRGWSRPRRRAE
jgi:hypothetical protein